MILGDPTGMDEDRIMDLSDDEPLLPESTRDDSVARYDSDTRYDADALWGERPRDRERWLQEERPPHWD